MKLLTILCDMDDVLENLVVEWVKDLDERYGIRRKAEDITDWHIQQFYPDLTKEQVFSPTKDPSFWDKLSRTEGSVSVICDLLEAGCTFKVVTASSYETIAPKTKWLLRNFPFFKAEDVIVAHDKSFIFGDLMIDDAPHNLETSRCQYKLLYDRPHNRKYDNDSNGIIRVHSWDEIYQVVTSIMRQE